MGYIADDIRESAATSLTHIEEVPPPEAQAILDRAIQLYARGRYSGYLWKDLEDPVAVQDPNAWRWIAEFVGNEPCVLFFDRDEESETFRVVDGSSLTMLLSETVGFEFYVTDDEVRYVLCFNHHDYLIAAGKAASWLASKAQAA